MPPAHSPPAPAGAPAPLSPLDRSIITALQVDGRASWTSIAGTLGEAERTVARHGSRLLAEGLVTVAGLRARSAAAVLRLECAAGAAPLTAEALAQRRDTTFSYQMSGRADCVAEIISDGDLTRVLVGEVPATAGVTRITSYPVLRYFRTVRGWHSGGLSPEQVSALRSERTADTPLPGHAVALTEQDEAVCVALIADGRASIEDIARRVGISDSTARRRVDWLLRSRTVQIRAVVEPALLGLRAEAFLWIRTAPGRIDAFGQRLAAIPAVRYAAAVAGDVQLIANVALPETASLYRFLAQSELTAEADSIEATLMMVARKRSGVRMPAR